VDIAKFKHVARTQDFRGLEFGYPYYFENTGSDFEGFLAWIQQLTQKTWSSLGLIGEARRIIS
jgi:transposase